MSNSEDNDIMSKGILQLLGKMDYDPATILRTCSHVSDGFVYERTPLFITLLCERCGEHYDIQNDAT